jgi:hypothetical protein
VGFAQARGGGEGVQSQWPVNILKIAFLSLFCDYNEINKL